MLILNYPSKKAIRCCIGQRLDYTETSMSGAEYRSSGNFTGSNRPYNPEFPKHSVRKGREYFAQVRMLDGLIAEVN